jgi:general secretion pathway protein K
VCAYLASLSSNAQRRSQRGAILIMVLLIVALVSALSIKFASQYQLGLARAESRWHGTQARAFLMGTEEVTKLLFPTADFDPKTDYLGEPWSNEVPIQDEGVTGTARLVDATAQINLNDITTALDAVKPLGDVTRYTEPQKRFIRLLQTFPELPLRSDEAAALLEAVVDWTDLDDIESGQGGAEANYYQGLKEPYKPASAPFKSLDELRLIRGFNELPLLVARLMPFITVLPFPNVGMNINTLTIESPASRELNGQNQDDSGRRSEQELNNLWLTLGASDSLEPVNPADMQRFVEDRPETGYPDANAITEALGRIFPGRQFDTLGLNIKTDFFWLESHVQLVDQRRSMRSLLWRGASAQGADPSATLKVIQREDMFELPNVIRVKKAKKSNKLWSDK